MKHKFTRLLFAAALFSCVARAEFISTSGTYTQTLTANNSLAPLNFSGAFEIQQFDSSLGEFGGILYGLTANFTLHWTVLSSGAPYGQDFVAWTALSLAGDSSLRSSGFARNVEVCGGPSPVACPDIYTPHFGEAVTSQFGQIVVPSNLFGTGTTEIPFSATLHPRAYDFVGYPSGDQVARFNYSFSYYYTPNEIISDVAHTPEPSTFALVGLSGLLIVAAQLLRHRRSVGSK